MDKIVEKELSYKLGGVFIGVHNKLGRFCREVQYGDEIEVVFKELGLNYKR